MKDDVTYNSELLRAIKESNLNIEEIATLCRVPEALFIRCLKGQTIIDAVLKHRLSVLMYQPIDRLWPGG